MNSEGDNPLKDFRNFFSIRLATALSDRQETFKIRYHVYCEEFGYEPAARFSQRMETDDFDGVASHCLITHTRSGQSAGCVRICPATVNEAPHPMPYEQSCAASLDRAAMAAMTAARRQLCEASRFAVDGAFRRRSGERLTRFGGINALTVEVGERRTFPLISVALMLAGTAMAELLGRPYMFAVMEPFLPRLLQRSGMTFRRMGRDLDHHGIRAVYLTDTRDFVRNLTGELQEVYAWIHDRLTTKCAAPEDPS
ncbi:PEP-CTERM/exosortase system-associated acyltransferase [uncultured Thiodictyon sp.]|jgi:N-acyl amino acid synthase of PEP-CTERM/exosortase system|uniref:PEP-CTERM/exosortase system-associated acyltransferase n=1 Tax=uncultured Thiodictyon sp. TaxID=1846217 RepID=UPI0025EBA156|nr:PEP-CTERM/exosortase system-associated acyltransferase [uncultured Thiodictyon sp.]